MLSLIVSRFILDLDGQGEPALADFWILSVCCIEVSINFCKQFVGHISNSISQPV